MFRTVFVALLITACGPGFSPAVEGTAPTTSESEIFYGQTSPTLYTSLTTAQQNAVVALCTPYGQGFCTGTIISPHVVLTAAHCIDTPQGSLGPDDIIIHVGPDYESPLTRLYVTAVDYKDYSLSYSDDIGIIILSDSYGSVDPIPIKRGGISGMLYGDAQSVGYGRTQSSSDYNPNPYRYWTTMDVIAVDSYSNQITVDGNGSTGVAPGDSGGPLLFDFGSGVNVSGAASTSVEGWVYEANYTSVVKHEAWIQQYVDYYDNPACISACAGVECGPTGSCECGTCAYGYECVSNQCQEIQPGSGGACLSLAATSTECTTSDQCDNDEMCFTYPEGGGSECAEICGPEPCAPGDSSSFCMPVPLQGGGYLNLCVEYTPNSCTNEYETCQATGGRSGYCLQLFQDEPMSCYAGCEPVVTCPEGTSCIATGPTDCNSLCSNVECGDIGGCDCGDNCGNGLKCESNQCVCAPSCEGKQCGTNSSCTDPTGQTCADQHCPVGNCGTCVYGFVCNQFGFCVPLEDTIDDGVKGNCGAAPAGPLAALAGLLALRRRRRTRPR